METFIDTVQTSGMHAVYKTNSKREYDILQPILPAGTIELVPQLNAPYILISPQ